MTTRILDANGQERLGNRLVGMVDWNTVGPVDDTNDPVAAEGGDLIVVGDLADDLTINLPANNEPGAQIAVYLAGDPDGNVVTVYPGANEINGDNEFQLDTQYQFLVLAFDGVDTWGIPSLGGTRGDVQSVFGATGDVLPSATAVGGGIANLSSVGVTGLTGAVSATRYAGGTPSIAPTTGTFADGDFVVSLDGSAWVCTVAGSPGTWVGLQSVLLAPKAAPTFSGVVTSDGVVRPAAAAAVTDAPRIDQLTSALTVTSGTLPNTGSWVSGTAKANPVTRQISVGVEVVTSGTATDATCVIAISPDNTTFTTVATPGASAAVNTVGGITLGSWVTLPSGWFIKLTFANCTVAASIYY